MGSTLISRINQLQRLANGILEERFKENFLNAYIEDTSFLTKNILGREIEVPSKLLRQSRLEDLNQLQSRFPIGTVAVLVPKNSIGLTVAKAIASSFLMGNRTLIYFPASLKNTGPIYAELLKSHLNDVEVITGGLSSAAFMRKCIKDPAVKAIVVYGDDNWIDAYKPLASEFKTKIVFEGPGNDPMVVFPDANLKDAVKGALEGGLNNGGQSCSALERFFVHQSCYSDFLGLLVEALSDFKLGGPSELETDIGPIRSSIIFNRLIQQIESAKAMGATIALGGEVVLDAETDLPILQPTVIGNCNIQMPVVQEESFGPVFPLVSFDSEQELIQMLDETRYGLNACAYGTTPKLVQDYLESTHRNVYYNSTAASSCNLPTRLMDGGFKRSGFIWDFTTEGIETTGRRMLAMELSKVNSNS
ncbi:MAG: hypothetical protein RLZZ241_223 [Bacteroidota bacterium]|jgi:succinate-semialdehyde dehydrogenase/glutarate-semialdehyde dehydrogenase